MSAPRAAANSAEVAVHIVVEIDGARYAIERDRMRGVARADEIRFAPEPGGAAARVRTAQGSLPIYDLPARFGAEPPRKRAYAVLIEGRPGCGLLVDRVVRREPVTATRLAALEIAGLPPALDAAYVDPDGEVVVLVDTASLPGDSSDESGHRGDRARGGRPTHSTRRSAAFESGRQPAAMEAAAGRLAGQAEALVVFELGRGGSGDFLALALGQVEEIVRVGRVRALVGAPAGVAGLTAWRDRAIPMIDPTVAIGLQTGRTSRFSRAAMVRLPGGGSLGLLSSTTPERLEIPGAAPLRLPVAADPTMLRGLFLWERGRLFVVDASALLGQAVSKPPGQLLRP